MLAALYESGERSLSALASNAHLGGVLIKEEDDVEEAGPGEVAEPVGFSTPSAPSTTDPFSSGQSGGRSRLPADR
eukprot:4757022-Alexandrium_andersonii.AAC.1